MICMLSQMAYQLWHSRVSVPLSLGSGHWLIINHEHVADVLCIMLSIIVSVVAVTRVGDVMTWVSWSESTTACH